MAEYAENGQPLLHFIAHEEWRCHKFENGLRGDIRLMVAPLSIKDFAALVEKARVIEKMKREVEGQRPQQSHSLRGLVDHLGPNLGMRNVRGRMIDPTISPRGLGVSLPNRAEYNAIYAEALT